MQLYHLSLSLLSLAFYLIKFLVWNAICFIFHFISCFFTLSFLPFYRSKSNICIPFSLQLWVIYYFPVLFKLLYVLCMSPFAILLILLDFWTLKLHSFPPLYLVICVLKLENIKISVLYIWYLFTVYMLIYFLCIFMFLRFFPSFWRKFFNISLHQ